jgi:hypothetical protein
MSAHIIDATEFRAKARAKQDGYFRAMLATVPEPVARAIILAVRDKTDRHFDTLPDDWRRRCLEVYREQAAQELSRAKNRPAKVIPMSRDRQGTG